jgi:uncharacterized protein (DUF2384 family)
MVKARSPAVPNREPKPGTGASFWDLMARWSIPDTQALQLVGQRPSASGKRPRFALDPEQAERLGMLLEIDRHATDIYQDAGEWVRRVNRSTMFAGMPPIALMAAEGREGIEAVLRHLNKMTFSGSVSR